MSETKRAYRRHWRRKFRKLSLQAHHMMAACGWCGGSGLAGDEDCFYCDGTGKEESSAWFAFMLLRGMPRWFIDHDLSPIDERDEEFPELA